MTFQEVMNKLQELCKKESAGENYQGAVNKGVNDILTKARTSMTDANFLEVQREILCIHHALAEVLCGLGYHTPGNDPGKPN